MHGISRYVAPETSSVYDHKPYKSGLLLGLDIDLDFNPGKITMAKKVHRIPTNRVIPVCQYAAPAACEVPLLRCTKVNLKSLRLLYYSCVDSKICFRAHCDIDDMITKLYFR